MIEKAGNVSGQSYAQLLRRPEISIDELAPALAKLYPEFFARDGLSLSSVQSGETVLTNSADVVPATTGVIPHPTGVILSAKRRICCSLARRRAGTVASRR